MVVVLDCLLLFVVLVCTCLLLPVEVTAGCVDPEQCWSTLSGKPTLVLGHRGDPYYVPEHSIASYAIALEEGVDYVEPDLVMTSDGVIVCAHGIQLSETTDIENVAKSNSSYLDRKRDSYYVDGTLPRLSDWFISDFAYEELQKLTLKQATYVGYNRTHAFNGMFRIPRFIDVIDYIQTRAQQLNIKVGIIPEIKHSTFFNVSFNRPAWYFEDQVLDILKSKNYDSNGVSPFGSVIIQSAEIDNLQYIRTKTQIPLMQLMFDYSSTIGRTEIFYDFMLTQKGLQEISKYANYIGIKRDFLLRDQASLWPQSAVSDTGVHFNATHRKDFGLYLDPYHILGLSHYLNVSVGIYTLRNAREDSLIQSMEQTLILANGGIIPGVDMGFQLQLTQFMKMGVDAIFVEKAGPAIYARNARIDQIQRYYSDDVYSRLEYWRRLAIGWIIFTIILVSCILYRLWRVIGQKRRLITRAQQRSEAESGNVSLLSDHHDAEQYGTGTQTLTRPRNGSGTETRVQADEPDSGVGLGLDVQSAIAPLSLTSSSSDGTSGALNHRGGRARHDSSENAALVGSDEP